MSGNVPRIVLNTGNTMPIIGLGTWKSKPGEVKTAVEHAISIGYRHIDGAFAYGNEPEVGAGVQSKIQDGTIKREDIFITDKLWNIHHAPKDVQPALMNTLSQLRLDYLDLYLIHWPQAYVNNGEMFPKDKEGKFIYDSTDYVDTWKEMIRLQKDGLVKDIGVSNFNQYQINRLIKETGVVPAVNQVELHPYLAQERLVKFCQENKVAITAYSPLGSADRPWAKEGEPVLLENPKILEIAKKLSKTPAQIVLRFQVQRGVIVIPKSVTKSRIESNFQIFDFKLSKEDMKVLFGFDLNFRGCGLEWVSDHRFYPFKENYSE